MDRRLFVKGAALGAGATALAACNETAGPAQDGVAAPAIVKRRRQLKLVTTWPKNLPGLGTAPEEIARHVREATDGAIDIRVYAAGELVGAFEAFDAVAIGGADMYHGAEYYWQGKSKAFNFFTAVPMGLTANEHMAWIYHGGGQDLWDELSAKFNIKPLMAGNTGVQMGGWFRKEINSLEDLKGLVIRMPGLGGEVVRRLGAAAIALPGGEIFTSLQTGAIDATEWVGPWNDTAMGFYQVAKYYYWPGFHEPGAALAIGVNLDTWNDFTAAEKRIVADACAAENSRNLAEFNALNTQALVKLQEDHGVRLRKFNDDILKKIAEVSEEVIYEAGQTDALTARVYDSFNEARIQSAQWSRISEEGFWRARRFSPVFQT